MKSPCRQKIPVVECRSPLGERGLKFHDDHIRQNLPRRSPLGERGLKSGQQIVLSLFHLSLPARGAWIEIEKDLGLDIDFVVAPR